MANEHLAPPPWGGYDFDKPSLAVVAVTEKDIGVVLWCVGGHILMEIEEGTMGVQSEDLGLYPPSPGIWVWEGKFVWSPGGYAPGGFESDGTVEPEGIFRAPSDAEWFAIRQNRSPWDDENWKLRCPCVRAELPFWAPTVECPRHWRSGGVVTDP